MTRLNTKLAPIVCLLAATLVTSGCLSSGGGEGEPVAAGSNLNRAPSISGKPASEAQAGDTYTFYPSAEDPDGDTLTFSIANRPAWASFDASNGLLSGTPRTADEGTYSDIRITVSDGTNSASLPSFALTVVTVGDKVVTLSWTPPTAYSDGSPLTDLAGYRIYYGLERGNYDKTVHIDNPGLSSYTVEGLLAQTYYFVATSINSSGIESSYSNVVTREAT